MAKMKKYDGIYAFENFAKSMNRNAFTDIVSGSVNNVNTVNSVSALNSVGSLNSVNSVGAENSVDIDDLRYISPAQPGEHVISSTGNRGALRGDSKAELTLPIKLSDDTKVYDPDGNLSSGGLSSSSSSGSSSASSSASSSGSGSSSGNLSSGTESGDQYTLVRGAKLSSVPQISENKKSFEEWLNFNGFAPESDYRNAKNQLEYDYMTAMANYGQNAEQLYRTGLSSSGVSDIFRVGAYSDYIKAQNDLAYALTEQKKAYRKEYNTYSENYDSALKSDYATAYNTALSLFDGTNADEIKRQLSVHGYRSDIVNKVVSGVKGLRKDVDVSGDSTNTTSLNFSTSSTSSTSSASSNPSALGGNAPTGNNGAVNEADAVDTVTVGELNVGSVGSAGAAGASNASNASSAGTGGVNAAGAVSNLSNTESEAGNTADPADLRQEAYLDVIDKIQSGIKAHKSVYSVYDIIGVYNGAKEVLPTKRPSGGYAHEKITDVTVNQVFDILNDRVSFDRAYSFVGTDKSVWDNFGDSEKLEAILSAVGELYLGGVFDERQSNSFFETWINKEASSLDNLDALVQIYDAVERLYARGYYSESEKNALIKTLSNAVKITKRYGVGKGRIETNIGEFSVAEDRSDTIMKIISAKHTN